MYKSQVVKIITNNNKPVSASQIIARLRAKKIHPNEATVFRILDSLLKHGTIRKISSRYELNNDDHHHFNCDKCGKILDINNCKLRPLIHDLEKKHLLVKSHILEFNGLCAQCHH